MIDLNELSAHLEVQTNILNDKRAERERYEQGVRAMLEASNKEIMIPCSAANCDKEVVYPANNGGLCKPCKAMLFELSFEASL